MSGSSTSTMIRYWNHKIRTRFCGIRMRMWSSNAQIQTLLQTLTRSDILVYLMQSVLWISDSTFQPVLDTFSSPISEVLKLISFPLLVSEIWKCTFRPTLVSKYLLLQRSRIIFHSTTEVLVQSKVISMTQSSTCTNKQNFSTLFFIKLKGLTSLFKVEASCSEGTGAQFNWAIRSYNWNEIN